MASQNITHWGKEHTDVSREYKESHKYLSKPYWRAQKPGLFILPPCISAALRVPFQRFRFSFLFVTISPWTTLQSLNRPPGLWSETTKGHPCHTQCDLVRPKFKANESGGRGWGSAVWQTHITLSLFSRSGARLAAFSSNFCSHLWAWSFLNYLH